MNICRSLLIFLYFMLRRSLEPWLKLSQTLMRFNWRET